MQYLHNTTTNCLCILHSTTSQHGPVPLHSELSLASFSRAIICSIKMHSTTSHVTIPDNKGCPILVFLTLRHCRSKHAQYNFLEFSFPIWYGSLCKVIHLLHLKAIMHSTTSHVTLSPEYRLLVCVCGYTVTLLSRLITLLLSDVLQVF